MPFSTQSTDKVPVKYVVSRFRVHDRELGFS